MSLRRIARVCAIPAILAGCVLALDRLYPPDLTRAQTLSAELRDSADHVLNLRVTYDGMIRLPPDATGPDLIPLLLSREDRRFWTHPGVDPLALLRAAAQRIAQGRVISGGSTIAMQVARLLEPHPHTLWGKAHDIIRGLQLQAHLGRSEILRLYLTLAPMGGNIEGVRAAALLYFGREPAALTRDQAALLVALPQSPTRRRPDRFPDAAWRAAERVLMAAGDGTAIVAEPITRAPLPALARHLAQHLSGRNRTTLDGPLQSAAEALALREVQWFGPDADTAALILRNRDRAVLAYIGGTRYFASAGMVDRVRAVRSPGSTLKPFIYAMAFDEGLASPATLLDDEALRLGTYAPRNFDRLTHGPRTAADALLLSLNRPAVRLLARIGPARFAAALRQAGANPRLGRGGAASAALALGGVGVTLFDLAGLYASLADGGAAQAPHWRETEPVRHGALVSRAAADQVSEILRRQPAPPGMAGTAEHPIAYKTGTSYGFRDGWAAGFTPEYTIVVWVGRRDGAPMPGVTGRDAAAPLLVRLFGLLPPEAPMPRPQPVARPLAPGLRRMADQTRLRILFPPGDVDLAFAPDRPIDLRAAGGTPPYRWLVDGAPLASGSGRANWTASGPGFAHLTVTDRDGRAASADVRLVAD